MSTTCPWCAAPRDAGPTCPSCGAIYAKAEAIKAHGRAAAPPPATAAPVRGVRSVGERSPDDGSTGEWHEVDDAELERRFCVGAIPVALLLAILFHASGLGAALQRIFLTMPVHEFGHAVSAWFCGYAALPTLWLTRIPDTRGWLAPLLLSAALGSLIFRAWHAANRPLMVAGGVLLLAQGVFTFGLQEKTAQMLFIFGGDGMGMILAIALMASFFFGKRTQLYKGSLRWGFVVIGAVAFVDMYATWWVARSNPDVIPFGTLNGDLTDASKLVEVYGWEITTLVNRYFALGIACLVALALVYAWGVRRAGREVRARRLAKQMAERLAASQEAAAG